MTADRLTDQLAVRVHGWRATPDRFIKPGRCWIPKWRFSPLTNLEDAFQLLEQATDRYTLTSVPVKRFTAEVQIGVRKGIAVGRSKPQIITIAVARALGIEDGK